MKLVSGQSLGVVVALAGPAVPSSAADAPTPAPVLTPAEQLETFQLAEPAYRIELVASEPLVEDPVAIQFDGEGRLWVVEMLGFMPDIDATGQNDPVGRVAVLADTDGDGAMDDRTVFLDGLVLPRAISVRPDGVLVAEDGKLWFARDTDGDLVCDEKSLVDPEYALDSIEHSANGLLPAVDNWVYNAKEGHRYRRQRDGTWSRDETEKRGQWGICQDDWGTLFYNYNHTALFVDVVPPNSFTRNRWHEPTSGTGAAVSLSNRIFPVRPTRAANRANLPGALDEEGRLKQFTSACAPLVYRGDLMGDLRGDAFVCEPVGNLVKRIEIDVARDGLSVTGADAYDGREFLASTDERFRPCALTHGPDGAIYIADIYRGVVQDGRYMSPYLRQHSIERGLDRPVCLGRIWRVVPAESGDSEPVKPDFGNASAAELVALLGHRAGWWRDLAQLHLVDRGMRDAVPDLLEMALGHGDPVARHHALWTLEGLGGITADELAPALADTSPSARAGAIRVVAALPGGDDLLVRTARDRRDGFGALSDRVALQWLISLGAMAADRGDVPDLIVELALPRLGDPLVRDAVLAGLESRAPQFLDHAWDRLMSLPEPSRPGAVILLESIATSVARSRDPAAATALLGRIATAPADWRSRALLGGFRVLGDDLARNPLELATAPAGTSAAVDPDVHRWFAWPGHRPEPVAVPDVKPLGQAGRQAFARGRQVYLTHCAACHGAGGRGLPQLAPPLAGSDWVTGPDAPLVRVVLHGLAGEITVSGKRYAAPDVQPVMPPLAGLGNSDIAAVLTYVRRAWGNSADPVRPGTVGRTRIATQGRTTPWTEAELGREPTTPNRPNILYIVADDLGYSDLGCYGGEIATPNLDALAADGVRLTQFYNTGRCCPSRASILTGRYPHRVGLGHMTQDIGRPGYRGKLAEGTETLADLLAGDGYRCFISGKWHLGTPDPTRHGFEEFYGTLTSAKTFFDPDHLIRLPDGREPIAYPPGEFYATDAVTNHALSFLQQARTTPTQPWFLYLAYHAPHFPLQAPADEIAKYADRYHGGWDELRSERLGRMKSLGIVPGDTELPPRSRFWNYGETETGTNPAWASLPAARRADLARRMAIYAAMVDRMDQQIGRVVADLRENNELDRTLIVFLSDNGACAEWSPTGFDFESGNENVLHQGGALDSMGGPGTFHSAGSGWANASNTPWRLYKHFNHEGGINSPAIVHWPTMSGVAAGSLHHAPAHLIDLVPTALAAAGFSDDDLTDLPGIDLIDQIRATPDEPRPLFFEHEGNRAVRLGHWKLVALRDEPWELYDFSESRTETNDVAADHPDVVRELAKMWDDWAATNHVTPLPNDYGVRYLRER